MRTIARWVAQRSNKMKLSGAAEFAREANGGTLIEGCRDCTDPRTA